MDDKIIKILCEQSIGGYSNLYNTISELYNELSEDKKVMFKSKFGFMPINKYIDFTDFEKYQNVELNYNKVIIYDSETEEEYELQYKSRKGLNGLCEVIKEWIYLVENNQIDYNVAENEGYFDKDERMKKLISIFQLVCDKTIIWIDEFVEDEEELWATIQFEKNYYGVHFVK
jgi:hypothetical protein